MEAKLNEKIAKNEEDVAYLSDLTFIVSLSKAYNNNGLMQRVIEMISSRLTKIIKSIM